MLRGRGAASGSVYMSTCPPPSRRARPPPLAPNDAPPTTLPPRPHPPSNDALRAAARAAARAATFDLLHVGREVTSRPSPDAAPRDVTAVSWLSGRLLTRPMVVTVTSRNELTPSSSRRSRGTLLPNCATPPTPPRSGRARRAPRRARGCAAPRRRCCCPGSRREHGANRARARARRRRAVVHGGLRVGASPSPGV